MAQRTRRRHRRPAATALAALTVAALAIPALTACGAVQKAMDCANTASAVADSVGKLQDAVGNAVDRPDDARKALDDIDTKLDKVSDSASDPELSKAVDRMNTGIKDVRKDLDAAKAPDITPITDAAGDMTKICTPG